MSEITGFERCDCRFPSNYETSELCGKCGLKHRDKDARKDTRKRAERTNVAILTNLVEWLDSRATLTGMSRSAFVSHLILKEKESQGLERLERLEKRVAALESK